MVEQVRLGIDVSSAVRLKLAGRAAEVEKTVQVVIEEDSAPGDPIPPCLGHHTILKAGGGGDVGKSAPVIVKQEGAADVGIEIVEPAVAVVVPHGDAHAVAARGRAHSRAHFREGPRQRIGATVVAKEFGAYLPIRAVIDEK